MATIAGWLVRHQLQHDGRINGDKWTVANEGMWTIGNGPLMGYRCGGRVMRTSLAVVTALVIGSGLVTNIGGFASSIRLVGVANAQQGQPGITIPLPNIPGVTTPAQPQQQQPYYQGRPYQGQPYSYPPPQGQQPYPPGARSPDYSSESYSQHCQDLAYRERNIRDRLAYTPAGEEHDRLVYRLGRIRSERERCQ